MKRSLTVLLPVRNVQSTLSQTVQNVLDMASDLNEQFELWILDDGSTDATSEVARDLARHYPQIRAFRHKKALGQEPVIRLAAAQCRGEVAFILDAGRPVFERLPLASKPLRPNFLNRSRGFVREGI